mmetsp:Transcript_14760/g.37237  ORF Transcript_14760/g.37237 Transcript_14760/m.37237 type:complete len:126 (+) Transcript_14760:102-479(+)
MSGALDGTGDSHGCCWSALTSIGTLLGTANDRVNAVSRMVPEWCRLPVRIRLPPMRKVFSRTRERALLDAVQRNLPTGLAVGYPTVEPLVAYSWLVGRELVVAPADAAGGVVQCVGFGREYMQIC